MTYPWPTRIAWATLAMLCVSNILGVLAERALASSIDALSSRLDLVERRSAAAYESSILARVDCSRCLCAAPKQEPSSILLPGHKSPIVLQPGPAHPSWKDGDKPVGPDDFSPYYGAVGGPCPADETGRNCR